MEKIEAISINGNEVPSGSKLETELERKDVYTHCSNTLFRVSKEDMPETHAWLIEQGMLLRGQAPTYRNEVICCMWGT